MVQITQQTSEEEFVAEILCAEFQSPRLRIQLRDLLEREQIPEQFLLDPDLSDPAQNQQRVHLLSCFKGYRQDSALFQGFPDDVTWWRGTLPHSELGQVLVIDHGELRQYLDGARSLSEVEERLRHTAIAKDAWIPHVVSKLKNKRAYRPILVGEKVDRLVILEGHLRLISWTLAATDSITEIDILLGVSPKMKQWVYF